MSKKTTDQKTEKQTEAKKPVVLKDDELDGVDGGFFMDYSGTLGTGITVKTRPVSGGGGGRDE